MTEIMSAKEKQAALNRDNKDTKQALLGACADAIESALIMKISVQIPEGTSEEAIGEVIRLLRRRGWDVKHMRSRGTLSLKERSYI